MNSTVDYNVLLWVVSNFERFGSRLSNLAEAYRPSCQSSHIQILRCFMQRIPLFQRTCQYGWIPTQTWSRKVRPQYRCGDMYWFWLGIYLLKNGCMHMEKDFWKNAWWETCEELPMLAITVHKGWRTPIYAFQIAGRSDTLIQLHLAD